MNKKLISIWMLVFCTSVGTSVQVAAMNWLKSNQTAQKKAEKAQNKEHLRIELNMKDEHDEADYLPNKYIKPFQKKGILILKEGNAVYLILTKDNVESLIDSTVNGSQVSSTKKALDNLTQKEFFKVISKVFEETSCICKNITYKKNEYASTGIDDLNNFEKYLKYGTGKQKAIFEILLEERKKQKNEINETHRGKLKKKNGYSLNKGQKIAGGTLISLGVIISIYYFVWGDKKEEEPNKKKKKGKINS